jgi:hypothetical protein
VGIIKNLRRCHLQLNTLEKLVFVSKNWPTNLETVYNSVELIEKDLNFEKLEGSFEWDEIMDIKSWNNFLSFSHILGILFI